MKLKKLLAIILMCGSNIFAMINSPCSAHDPHALLFYICKATTNQSRPCLTKHDNLITLKKHLRDYHGWKSAKNAERFSEFIVEKILQHKLPYPLLAKL